MEYTPDKSNFITFVSESLTVTGFTFVYQGTHPDCEACSLFPVCQENFEYLRRYEVTEVRDVKRPCEKGLHREKMQVVRVREVIPPITWQKKGAFIGTSLRFRTRVCDLVECPHFTTCVPPNGIRPRDRFRILEILEDLSAQCAKGYSLVKCRVEKLVKK